MEPLIFWKYQLMQDIPDDQSWLSESELKQYQQFRFPKRQKDWLSGRFVGKSLIKAVVFEADSILLNQLTIQNEPGGAPYPQYNQSRLNGSLSLSHRDSFAAAAWCNDEDVTIGIDLEAIETKSTGFIEDYFSKGEAEVVLTLPVEQRDVAASLLWSGKEAILKALKIGLRVDTRKLIIEVPDIKRKESWSKLTVLESPGGADNFQLFWKCIGDLIISLAIKSEKQAYKFSPASICQIF